MKCDHLKFLFACKAMLISITIGLLMSMGSIAIGQELTMTGKCAITEDCFTLELLQKEVNNDGSTSYTWRLSANDCVKDVSYVAFQIPMGSMVSSPEKKYKGQFASYKVKNTNNNPFYSVKFKTIDKGIQFAGESEVFEYTLPSGIAELSIPLVAVKYDDNRVTFSFDLNACQPSSIGDRVWSDTNSDGVQGVEELGIDGVTVNLTEAGVDEFLGTADDVIFPTIVTSGGGGYDFTGLQAGRYQVAVDLTSGPIFDLDLTTNGWFNVDLNVDQDFNDADFGFEPITEPVDQAVHDITEQVFSARLPSSMDDYNVTDPIIMPWTHTSLIDADLSPSAFSTTDDVVKLSAYPNPGRSYVHVDKLEAFVGGTYKLHNIGGTGIYGGSIDKANFELNMEELIPGTYMLIVRNRKLKGHAIVIKM